MGVFDPFLFLVVSAGIFAGAVVSGLVGFAFSAVAGAILLHVLPPTEAVPLMMACSIVTQTISLVALRGTVKWEGNPLLIGGGVLGLIPALYLLYHVDAYFFRIGFGAFLVAYAAWMLLRPKAALSRQAPGGLRHALVGFGGGLIGGLTAMPGALPVIWCDLRGMAKDQQRALTQPYTLTMQIVALALMLAHNTFSNQTLVNLTYSLPALVAGAALGVITFRRINDRFFRGAVLMLLFAAGLGLVV